MSLTTVAEDAGNWSPHPSGKDQQALENGDPKKDLNPADPNFYSPFLSLPR